MNTEIRHGEIDLDQPRPTHSGRAVWYPIVVSKIFPW